MEKPSSNHSIIFAEDESDCRRNYDIFRDHLQGIGYFADQRFAATTFVMLGPVLWTSCGVGLIANALVLLASISTTITSTSMCIIAIAGCLAMKAASLLLLLDLEQGQCIAQRFTGLQHKLESVT